MKKSSVDILIKFSFHVPQSISHSGYSVEQHERLIVGWIKFFWKNYRFNEAIMLAIEGRDVLLGGSDWILSPSAL